MRRVSSRFSLLKKLALPNLKFDHGDLAPVLSKPAMELHHKKHHQAYINKYNKAAEDFLAAENKSDFREMQKQLNLLEFNLGGHENHSFFWDSLCPPAKSQAPHSGALFDRLQTDFGGVDKFIQAFNEKTEVIQGSGWGWLAYNPLTKGLLYAQTPNQEGLGKSGLVPLLTVDVWEHAYYVNYENMRGKFLQEIWKVVDWKKIEERFAQAQAKK